MDKERHKLGIWLFRIQEGLQQLQHVLKWADLQVRVALKALDTCELQRHPRSCICHVEILITSILDSGTYTASQEELGPDQQGSYMPNCSQDFWK